MTDTDDTNYYFECSNEGFEGALDRLAQFFISPNFSESSSDREVQAVNSEFVQSKSSEYWHYLFVSKDVANKESAYFHHDFGNLETLQKPGIREALLDFHKKWYSANIMTLTVVAKAEIATLEQWVRDKFSAIVNKEVTIPDLSEPPAYPPENLKKLVKYVPVKEKDVLTILFDLPYTELDHKTCPTKYLVELIGHEGENSLLSYLKHQNWAIDLSTDAQHMMKCLT